MTLLIRIKTGFLKIYKRKAFILLFSLDFVHSHPIHLQPLTIGLLSSELLTGSLPGPYRGLPRGLDCIKALWAGWRAEGCCLLTSDLRPLSSSGNVATAKITPIGIQTINIAQDDPNIHDPIPATNSTVTQPIPPIHRRRRLRLLECRPDQQAFV